ncbi:hypothetical protein [Emticicia fluvialis]|uniref:hypothetical protein n=1 Tax=Emticicia fluvialis TaxID=2974474 RepID=UPI002165CB1D|nr:hypothetical protein [Emticicia fluvialis]
MNQDFKLRIGQMKENNPAQSETEPQGDDDEQYQSKGSIRTFALIWKDGRMLGIPYAYVSGFKFAMENEKNVITIELSSEKIKLYGYGLATLYWQFFDQLPRIIREEDERYAKQKACVVTRIEIEEKK